VKTTIYIETSVLSYLASRPSLDAIKAARQFASQKLWQSKRKYRLVVSQLVLDEAAAGSAAAARERLVLGKALPCLDVSAQAIEIARTLMLSKAFPANAYADALHVAIAASERCDLIASWNYRHIANPMARRKVETCLEGLGVKVPIITTPDALLEIE
jgi:predicted nucleic acid-binding protein